MQLNEQEQNSPVDVNALAFVSCSCVMVSAQVVVSGWMDDGTPTLHSDSVHFTNADRELLCYVRSDGERQAVHNSHRIRECMHVPVCDPLTETVTGTEDRGRYYHMSHRCPLLVAAAVAAQGDSAAGIAVAATVAAAVASAISAYIYISIVVQLLLLDLQLLLLWAGCAVDGVAVSSLACYTCRYCCCYCLPSLVGCAATAIPYCWWRRSDVDNAVDLHYDCCSLPVVSHFSSCTVTDQIVSSRLCFSSKCIFYLCFGWVI